MNSILLSRLTKNFLNQDLATISSRERYRLGWTGSVLASYPQKLGANNKKSAEALLIALKKRLSSLFETSESEPIIQSASPRLSKPIDPPQATFRPPWYFSRGAIEMDRRKNPDPILYLLTETNETAQARPVPGNSLLIRSLCKGKGVLKRNKQGLIFLDVDNRFISTLLPYLKAHKLEQPPYFNLFTSPDGAHVPVIPAREAAFQYLDEIEEIDQEFSFEVEGLFSMEPVSWPEVEQVWFFKIRSETLENLRRRYFLPSTPAGHPFHIAVAVKPRPTVSKSPLPSPIMRINPAFVAA